MKKLNELLGTEFPNYPGRHGQHRHRRICRRLL